MRRQLALLHAVLALGLAWSAPARAQNSSPPPPVELAGGFTEAVITTADAEGWIEMLTMVAGWEVRHRAPLSAGEAALWDLPETTRGETVLLANRGEDRGYLRLVALRGVEQEHIRIDDRPWDTGGIFDFNMRVADMEATRAALHARGWSGESPPVRFTFGPFTVVEWIVRGPDGARIAMIQRVAPELEGWPNLTALSRVFNSTTTVEDIEEGRAFLEDVLGMQLYLESRRPSGAPGPNVLGLPHNVTTMIARDVLIMHPEGVNEGSVELLQFVGGPGADLSGRTARHNLGVSTLRFPVADIDEAVARLRAHDVELSGDPVALDLVPYSRVRMIGLRGPGGVWYELYGPEAQP